MPVRLLASLALVLAACGAPSGPALSYGESARRDYERALEAFEDDDCLTAVPLLQNVRREYSYSRYAALAELRLADCELEQQHYTEAIRAYRAFVRQRPTHPEVDTANFSIARAYYRQIPQELFLSPPPEERDQTATRSALRVVRRFLADYPESDHVEEAQRIERAVLSLLAKHELYVANYYLVRDRPLATLYRVRTLLEEYTGSGLEPEALVLLGRTHLHMREQRQAEQAFGEVIQRFPESGFAVQARNYLTAMGREIPVFDRAPSEPDDEADDADPPAEEEELLEGDDVVPDEDATPEEEDVEEEAESAREEARAP